MEDDARKSPGSLREYLETTAEVMVVIRWIISNVISPHSFKYMRRMLAFIMLMMISQVLSPFAVAYVFDGLTKRSDQTVIYGMVGFAVLLIMNKYCQKCYDSAREWVIGLNWAKLDSTMDRLFFSMSLAQHAQNSGRLSATTVDKGKYRILDIQKILLFDAIPVALQLVMSLICLMFLSAIAGSIMLCVVLAYALWSLYLNVEVGRVCVPLDKRFRKYNRRRVDRMDHVDRVVTSGQTTREIGELRNEFSGLMSDDRKFWLRFINVAFMRSLLNAIGLIVIMSWGAWLVWKGELTLGLLYPLYSWATRVSENIWRLGDIEHQINWNLTPAKSVIEAVSVAPDIVDYPDAKALASDELITVEFSELCHTYSGVNGEGNSLPHAVRNVSFKIEPGEKVALLGPSGSGKTTLMKLLLRFADPSSGSIRINGIDLRNIALDSWRNSVAYIPQQPQILDGTIRYNLTFALNEDDRSKVTDDELWSLMRLLQIDFGERLTHGLQTRVGRNGMKLSGGQAQRLMIGAALIRRCKLIVIDEATSSLDSTTEAKVQKGLEKLLGESGSSALVVAHRLSTVRGMCNKFVVLRSASGIPDGGSQIDGVASSFEQLYQISPVFRQLADDQGLVFEVAA